MDTENGKLASLTKMLPFSPITWLEFLLLGMIILSEINLFYFTRYLGLNSVFRTCQTRTLITWVMPASLFDYSYFFLYRILCSCQGPALDNDPPIYTSHVPGIINVKLCLDYLLRWALTSFLPGLTSNHNSWDCHLPRIWDHEECVPLNLKDFLVSGNSSEKWKLFISCLSLRLY
jgi:hypothetical protein